MFSLAHNSRSNTDPHLSRHQNTHKQNKPILPSFVHVFVLLHHDGVGRRHVDDDPDGGRKRGRVITGGRGSDRKRLWDAARPRSYCAVLVRMDVRRACSSVRAEGTVGEIQSFPLGGLLTGFGCGISSLRSSESYSGSARTRRVDGDVVGSRRLQK